MPAFAEAPDERARMGRISGVLWILAALVAVVGCFLPGAEHAAMGWVFALSAVFFAYGLGIAHRLDPLGARLDERCWRSAWSLTIPVVGLAIYLTGGSTQLRRADAGLLAALRRPSSSPPSWAWPLAIELVLVAGTPLLYDADAIDNAFLPRYLALVAGFLSVDLGAGRAAASGCSPPSCASATSPTATRSPASPTGASSTRP